MRWVERPVQRSLASLWVCAWVLPKLAPVGMCFLLSNEYRQTLRINAVWTTRLGRTAKRCGARLALRGIDGRACVGEVVPLAGLDRSLAGLCRVVVTHPRCSPDRLGAAATTSGSARP